MISKRPMEWFANGLFQRGALFSLHQPASRKPTCVSLVPWGGTFVSVLLYGSSRTILWQTLLRTSGILRKTFSVTSTLAAKTAVKNLKSFVWRNHFQKPLLSDEMQRRFLINMWLFINKNKECYSLLSFAHIASMISP